MSQTQTRPAAGDPAPDFAMATDGGGQVSLSDFKGQPLVLYFYPKDDTSGCTKEAQAFRDAKAAFDELGVTIVGVSKDSVKKHDTFKEKYELNFPLGSDPEGAVCEAYGVWVEKSMYGRTYMGIERSTFLIDGAGVVAKAWRKVKVAGHAEAVLDAARQLKGAS
ncbi:thioredoxin-dependent thiol peroxidase [Roseospirillum parvum]|uniref:thioredoxin-dependent peroxiredoxin n=1 Tax=Roseospirillum parvum TaxID=83401 RepID=A0A1G7U2M5_9PROT|nr:thioredoxin-dependent thiol peroxidase [Roseospirillum parvum]SDG41806.1 glutamate-ammonia-ligase adenylyltransferase/peroxiredoxin Q/BCP [Roseospirillum parvum]